MEKESLNRFTFIIIWGGGGSRQIQLFTKNVSLDSTRQILKTTDFRLALGAAVNRKPQEMSRICLTCK